ncbi:MAG: MDR/zinc-dependent alcohol dehydrogenase-like family protein [Candidatus Binataceae bacterium]
MRALVLNEKLSFDPHYAQPAPRRGESLVRVHMAGICGTDLELASGYMTYSGIPGHEFIGHVQESADSRMIGMRVAGEINAACGTCDFCLAELGRHCVNRTVLGIVGRDGSFADYLTLPNENLVPIPDALSDEVAVFIEPVAAAYEIFAQTQIGRNQTIAVLGDGRLGAVVAMVLKGEGYRPLLAGHHEEKLQCLARLGIAVELEAKLNSGFDVVIDSSGSSAGFNRAATLVKPRGRLILKSTAAASAPMNLAPLVVNEITVVGSRCGRFAPAVAALAEDKLDPRPLISAHYPLEQAVEAFAAASIPANFKVLLNIS